MRHCDSALNLLKRLIATPSVSRDESATADILEAELKARGFSPERLHNNLLAWAQPYDPHKPTLLLNSHHDTVKPSPAYTRDPFAPAVEDGRLYGLGSNDAGASLVGLIEVFTHFSSLQFPFNLLLVLSAEEEVTGEHGMREVISTLQNRNIIPDWGIIGEPTSMNVAIGERGLVVLDCVATARGGHAARPEGENALYKALDDIRTLRALRLPVESELLGPVKFTVTQIQAGRQHNVLPEECRFVVDIRTTDAMSNEDVVRYVAARVHSAVTPRSTRIHASAISADHPLVRAAIAAGASPFVSPTTSDQSVLPMFPTIKIGIGESSRSHTPDEFVEIAEIERGIERYIQIINNFANETLG